jgi:GGDEF domain-containing protein
VTLAATEPTASVVDLIAHHLLVPHFQPIASLTDGSLFGHEALMRTPAGCPHTSPDLLFEAARHANPLTLLPGNIPITQHMRRLLDAQRDFVACHADLNHFKPFNDLYGYWRGDEMILLAARSISEFADPRRHFVGHVGGDDFLVMSSSAAVAKRRAKAAHSGVLVLDRDGPAGPTAGAS